MTTTTIRLLAAASMCATTLILSACHENDRMDDDDRMYENRHMRSDQTYKHDSDREHLNSSDKKSSDWNRKDMSSMSLTEFPAGVQSTLQRESSGATLSNTCRMEKDGMTVYEADTMIDGTSYKLCVDQNGQLLTKTRSDIVDKMKSKMEKMDHNR